MVSHVLYTNTANITNFDPNFNREVFNDKIVNAYFGYFDADPLYKMIDQLEEDNNYNPEHVIRALAGLVELWQQKEGKDATKFHFFEGGI